MHCTRVPFRDRAFSTAFQFFDRTSVAKAEQRVWVPLDARGGRVAQMRTSGRTLVPTARAIAYFQRHPREGKRCHRKCAPTQPLLIGTRVQKKRSRTTRRVCTNDVVVETPTRPEVDGTTECDWEGDCISLHDLDAVLTEWEEPPPTYCGNNRCFARCASPEPWLGLEFGAVADHAPRRMLHFDTTVCGSDVAGELICDEVVDAEWDAAAPQQPQLAETLPAIVITADVLRSASRKMPWAMEMEEALAFGYIASYCRPRQLETTNVAPKALIVKCARCTA